MELYKKSIKDIKTMIDKGEVSGQEVKKTFLKRLESVEDEVKAFINVNKNAEGGEGELAGIPIAVKDNMSTIEMETTCASQILEGYQPPYDATAVKKLKENGAIIIAKTNMDEFAMGSSTENSGHFPTRNPWNTSHVPGGSSGGSAAAVAAGEVPAALGSDTGGSIRQPASFCGVVGLKPTYGLVSRYGLIAFASSLDQIGPITKNVTDSALLLNTIAGHDPRDSTSVKRDLPDFTDYLNNEIKDMKIAIPSEYFSLEFDVEVKEKVKSGIAELEKAGAAVEEVDLISAEYALAAYYIIAPAEASSNLARYDGVRYGYRNKEATNLIDMFTKTRSEGFGDEVKRRILLGTYALSSGYYDDFYLKAQKVRTLIKNDFEKIFDEYDLIITPTSPTTAFKIGEDKSPIEMYHADIFTVPVNIAGLPALSLPCGFDSDNMPVGLQMIGPHFGEGKILKAAYTLEQILDLNLSPEI